MDELKLNTWKERFLTEVTNTSIAASTYNLSLNESDEWALAFNDNASADIKEQLTQLLESTKPEDSV